LRVNNNSTDFAAFVHEMKLRLLGIDEPPIIVVVHFVAVDHDLQDARIVFAPKPGDPDLRRRFAHAYLTNSRIALSRPSSVSGYIRSPISWRMMRIDWVKSHSCSGTGLSHTQAG
jgi:hypothetical protein